MYCQNCGKEVFGKYCSNCGTKVVAENESESDINWSLEKDFSKLVKYPEIRNLISRYAGESSKKSSAKDFLGMVDIVFAPISEFSLEKMSDIIVPIFQKIGIATGKSETRNYKQSIQQLIVKSLCSLAKNGYPLESCQKATNGTVLTATIPSDMWTWGGNIVISIEVQNSFCKIDIATKIKGQMYDWGKSKKLIQRFFIDVETIKLNEIR